MKHHAMKIIEEYRCSSIILNFSGGGQLWKMHREKKGRGGR
jgi:hypothetical protein